LKKTADKSKPFTKLSGIRRLIMSCIERYKKDKRKNRFKTTKNKASPKPSKLKVIKFKKEKVAKKKIKIPTISISINVFSEIFFFKMLFFRKSDALKVEKGITKNSVLIVSLSLTFTK